MKGVLTLRTVLKRKVVLRSASSLPTASLVDCVNIAYSDYPVPIQLSIDEFEDLIYRESIHLAYSVAAVSGKKVVGTGMLALRGKRAWIGGMGVAPAMRGQGIGRSMMRYLIEQAVSCHVDSIQLEVLQQNTPASELYKSFGFKTVRTLSVLTGTICPPFSEEHELRLRECDPQTLLRQTSAIREPWQRESHSLEGIQDRMRALQVLNQDDSVSGSCVFHSDTEGIGLLRLSSQDATACQNLLAGLSTIQSGRRISYVNVPQEDPALSHLIQLDFREAFKQNEMMLLV